MEAKTKKGLEVLAAQIRLEVYKELVAFGGGHIGGSMSIADTMAVLYGEAMKYDPKNKDWEDRDYLALSKGHAGPALYATLAIKGFFPMAWLSTLNKNGTNLPSHCSRIHTPGVDLTTGSLGTGISPAVGVAVASKIMGKDNYSYCIVGDGESDEGQVWETCLFAAAKKLDNFILFIDSNKQQLDGYIDDVLPLGNLEAKMNAFDFYTQSIDGHDVEAISKAIKNAKNQSGKPSCIILNTIKGKGSEVAEKAGLCHYLPLDMLGEKANSAETARLQKVYDDLKAEWEAM